MMIESFLTLRIGSGGWIRTNGYRGDIGAGFGLISRLRLLTNLNTSFNKTPQPFGKPGGLSYRSGIFLAYPDLVVKTRLTHQHRPLNRVTCFPVRMHFVKRCLL